MKKVFITCKSAEDEGAWYDLWQLARVRFMEYAKRHGYDYREVFYEDFDEEKWPGIIAGRKPAWPHCPGMTSPCWLKIPAIAEALEEYEVVTYMDNDCVILDMAEDIADQLPEGKWLAMHDATTSEGCGPNIGVVVTRSCERSKAFWRQAWDIDAWKTAKWTDNGQVMALLGYTTAPPLQKVRDTEWTEGYHVLPETWNNYAHHGEPCKVFHAAWGRSGEWKLQVMKEAIGG